MTTEKHADELWRRIETHLDQQSLDLELCSHGSEMSCVLLR